MENTVPSRLPLSWWAWALFLRPRATVSYLHMRFRCWACLPGDVFEDFQQDCLYVVRRRRRDGVEAWRLPGEIVYMDASRPPTLSVVPSAEQRWTLPPREQAQRAREAVAA